MDAQWKQRLHIIWTEHKKWKKKNASKKVHHLWCITSYLLPAGAEHHAAALHPAHLGGLHTLILSYSHTVTLSHPLLHPQDSVALIIAPNLEDGHRPNLLVPLSNHLILKDHRPNLLGLNDYSVESTRRRWFHRLSGNKLVLMVMVIREALREVNLWHYHNRLFWLSWLFWAHNMYEKYQTK